MLKNIRDEFGQICWFKSGGQEPRLSIVDLPFFGRVSLGNMTAFDIYFNKVNESYFDVGIVGKGFFRFKVEPKIYFGYVAEKLNLAFTSDAKAVADFINCQFGCKEYFSEPRVEYVRILDGHSNYDAN